MKNPILTFATTALLTASVSSTAQGQRQSGRTTQRIPLLVQTLDQDSNGEISPSELEQAPASLARLDKDNDGMLVASEMATRTRDARSSRQRGRRNGGRGIADLGATTLDLGEPGIAWYGRLDTALSEAKRSNRPILFMAAASQCNGVPGVF